MNIEKYFVCFFVFTASSYCSQRNHVQKWKPQLFSIYEKSKPDQKQLEKFHFKHNRKPSPPREIITSVERMERGSLIRKASYMLAEPKTVDASECFEFKDNPNLQ